MRNLTRGVAFLVGVSALVVTANVAGADSTAKPEAQPAAGKVKRGPRGLEDREAGPDGEALSAHRVHPESPVPRDPRVRVGCRASVGHRDHRRSRRLSR